MVAGCLSHPWMAYISVIIMADTVLHNLYAYVIWHYNCKGLHINKYKKGHEKRWLTDTSKFYPTFFKKDLNCYTPSIRIAAGSDSGYCSAILNFGEEQIIITISNTEISWSLVLTSIWFSSRTENSWERHELYRIMNSLYRFPATKW